MAIARDRLISTGGKAGNLCNHREIASDFEWFQETLYQQMVPGAGIEPARLSAPDFKSGMSTNFIIRASPPTYKVAH